MGLKRYVKAGLKYISSREYRIKINAVLGFYNKMPDDQYLKKMFEVSMGKPLDLDNPQTFNEKLQWLKLHDRKPEYTVYVDKYKVREYIKETIGEEYLIPLLGVWDTPDEIDFDSLPDKFVLKCNHNSGLGMCICRDKSKLDIKKVKKELWRGLKQDYYLTGREWPYKDVPRKIIAEQYMEDNSSTQPQLTDYKLMCFGGHVKCSFTCTGRGTASDFKVTFYDTDWEKMPFERHYPAGDAQPKPKTYDEMVALAEKLARNIPFSRIDFYEIEGNLYFGEITLFPGSGMEEFTPESWDYTLGKLIELPSGGGYLIAGDGWLLLVRNSCKDGHELSDYKVHVFNGRAEFILYCSERFSAAGLKEDWFDRDWNHLDMGRPGIRKSSVSPARPVNLEKMLSLAETLAKGMSFARVDFYEISGQLKFGEITFFPASGMAPFEPEGVDAKLGEMIELAI